ncbi:MAG: hypothetical protein L6Q99_06975 [Planctomycetes bacterium]|nr:hypothetical protein [Planctomycetota bacterium]
MTRRRVAAGIALGLCALGCIDVVLVCRQLGWQDGLITAAHDPGKFFFHIVLLPIAALALVLAFPVELVELLWTNRRKRWALVVLTAISVLSASMYGARDAVAGFETRLPWPPDVDSSIVVEDAPSLSAARYLARERARLRAAARAGELDSTESVEAYTAVVDSVLGESRSYWRQSSLRAKWASLLTVIGAACAGAIVATIGILVLSRAFEQETVRALALIVMLLSTWLVLRGYSEWWGNLDRLDITAYTPFVIVGVIIAVAAFFLWLLRDWKHPTAVAAGTLGAVVAIAAGVEKLKPEWVSAIALAVSNYGLSEMLVLYTAGAMAAAGLVYLLWPRTA